MSKSTVISAITALAIASLSTISITPTATATPSGSSYTSSFDSSGSSASITSSIFDGLSSKQTTEDQPGENVESPVFRAVAGVGKDGNSVNFSWRTNYEGDEFVRFAPKDNLNGVRVVDAVEAKYGADEYRSMHAEVSDLEPGTTYAYQLGSEKGGWSDPEYFTVDDGGDTWKFVTITDAQVGQFNQGKTLGDPNAEGRDPDDVIEKRLAEQAATWRQTISKAIEKNPDASLILSAGDQVEGWGDLSKEYDAFFSAPELRKYPTAVLEGNHELYPNEPVGIGDVGINHFKEHFKMPNEVEQTSNYFFEHNNALFIGLNSNRESPEELEETAQFVRDTVEEHGGDKDWIIVASHFAYYSSGHRYPQEKMKNMRETLSPVFTEVGVDLVLNGHDHQYNRSHLMRGVDPVVPEKPAEPGDVLAREKGDVLYLTLNTAGGGKYYDFHNRFDKNAKGTTNEIAQKNGLLRKEVAFFNQEYKVDYSVVDVTKDELRIRTHHVDDNSIVDDVTIKNYREKKSEEDPSDDSSSLSSEGSSGSSLGK